MALTIGGDARLDLAEFGAIDAHFAIGSSSR